MDEIRFSLKPEQMLEIIKKCSYDAFFISDKEGITCFINDAYERITGVNPDKLIGRNLSALKELNVIDVTAAEKVLKSHQPTSMMLHYKNDKNVLATTIPVFDKGGNFIAIVGNLHDMTELNKLKKKLDTITQQSMLVSEELAVVKNLNQLADDFVCKSPAMQKILDLATRIAKVESTVLIEGESGVGKDVYAHIINSLTCSLANETRPFVKISCGAIPENLLESELFGYEYGSFTGAKKEGKPGLFELAQNGIVFLDEIGEMPLSLQVKLLNVLQDREFFRIGGTKPIRMRARVIAATNVNLVDAVRNRAFREDLYFRLNVLNVRIPPLRERKEDIDALVIMAVNNLNKKYDMNKTIDEEILEVFERYSWPGNIRELLNVIERLVVLSPKDLITSDQLPDRLRDVDEKSRLYTDFLKEDLTLSECLKQMEFSKISRVLEKHLTLKDAAEELGIDLSTLTRKMSKHNIPKRYRAKYIHKDDVNTRL